MLLFLSSHRDFDKMLEKFISAKDLPAIRDTVFTLKTKVCTNIESKKQAVFENQPIYIIICINIYIYAVLIKSFIIRSLYHCHFKLFKL